MGNNYAYMKRDLGQAGFIPLLIVILMVVAAIVYLAYTRVLHAQR